MAETIRHASVYYQGKKVAMFSGFEETLETGNEDQVADEGWIGVSDGAKMTKLSTDAIVPVKGIGVSLIKDMLNNKYIDIGLGIVDGTIHKITMSIMRATITSEAANGTLKGKFEFSGGKPVIIG